MERMLRTLRHTPRSGGGRQHIRSRPPGRSLCCSTPSDDEAATSRCNSALYVPGVKAYHRTAGHEMPHSRRPQHARKKKKQPSKELQNAACPPRGGGPHRRTRGDPTPRLQWPKRANAQEAAGPHSQSQERAAAGQALRGAFVATSKNKYCTVCENKRNMSETGDAALPRNANLTKLGRH